MPFTIDLEDPKKKPLVMDLSDTAPAPLTAQDARTAFGRELPQDESIVDKLFGAYDAVTQRSQAGFNRIEGALQQYATTPRESDPGASVVMNPVTQLPMVIPKDVGGLAENILKGTLKFPPEMLGAVLNDIKEFGPGYAAAKFGTGIVDFFVGAGQDITTRITGQPFPRDRKGITGRFEEAYRGLRGEDFTAPDVPGFAESASETAERIFQDPVPLLLAATGGLAKAKPIQKFRFAKETVKGAIGDVKTTRAVSEQIARGPQVKPIEIRKAPTKPATIEAPKPPQVKAAKPVTLDKPVDIAVDKPALKPSWEIAQNKAGRWHITDKKTGRTIGPGFDKEANAIIFGNKHKIFGDKLMPEIKTEPQKRSLPTRDVELTTVGEMSERIKSIDNQIDKIDVGAGRSAVVYDKKIKLLGKLNKRKNALIERRKGLPKQPTIPEKIAVAAEPSKAVRGIPIKGKAPETIAKELDLVFNGMQERPKGKPPVFTFTDKKTGSTFLVDDLAKVEGRLREVKKSFGKPSKPPDLKPPAKGKPDYLASTQKSEFEKVGGKWYEILQDIKGETSRRLVTGKRRAYLERIKRPVSDFVEFHAGLTPKVVGETFRKTLPEGVKQLKNRLKTEPGKTLVKQVRIVDDKSHRRWGQGVEKLRQAGLKKMNEKQGIDLAERMDAGKAPEYKKVMDEVFFKAKALGVKIPGYRKNYFPRMMKKNVSEVIWDDLRSLEKKYKDVEKLGHKADDPVLSNMIEAAYNANEIKGRTRLALKHLIDTKQAKNFGEAYWKLKQQAGADQFRQFGNLEKSRILELPKDFYERDARKVLPRYIEAATKRMSEVEMWGLEGEKALALIDKIKTSNPREAAIAQKMLDIWTGEMERTRGLSGTARKITDVLTGYEFTSKIALGTATIPNITQPLISIIPVTGYGRFLRAGARLFLPSVRSRVRASGATIPTAMRAMAGYEPTGLMNRFADRVGFHFRGINKVNQYLAASSAEIFVKDIHRIARGSGRRAKWAKSWAEKFNIDPAKKLTENQVFEAMYRFATDSQLQKNILADPLAFNIPSIRPWMLFKRFGYRQAAWIKDTIIKQELIGNKNPMPVLRLVAGGIIGGEFVIWAKNKIRQLLSGEPVYRKDDDIWERVVDDLGAVGAVGMISDMLTADYGIARQAEFLVTPVYASDFIKAVDVLKQTEEDYKKYDDWAIVAKRSPKRFGHFLGTLPKYLTLRTQTAGQKKGRVRFFKGKERGEIINLILEGKGEAAGKRIALWNQNYPLSPIEIGFDDIKRKIISKMKF